MKPPHSRDAPLDESGRFKTHWYRFFDSLRTDSSESSGSALPSLAGFGIYVWTQFGAFARRIVSNTLTVTNGGGEGGDIRVELSALPNIGVGDDGLCVITRDEYGRLEGTAPATAADLAFDDADIASGAEDVQAALVKALGALVYFSDTAPDPDLHPYWCDTTDMTPYVWYDDGTSAAWVSIFGGGGATAAAGVSYDNTTSGLTATDVQAAIDELAAGGGGSGDVAGDTHAAASKTTPVDADEIPLVDSAASFGLKKLTWANLKATAKTYFDTLYRSVSTTIGTSDIANGAVTYAKLQNVSATSRILGRKSASAGDAEECTLSEILDFIGSAAQGDILYRSSSGWARLGAGSLGQVLQTNGAGANPSWATPVTGSAWTMVKKSSDTSRNTTTTLADDPALQFACTSGTTYVVKAHVVINVLATATGFKWTPAFSAAFTEKFTLRRQHNPAAAIGTANEQQMISTGIMNAAVAMTFGQTGVAYVHIECCFTASANGTFSFQWAQNTSSATNVTVMAGSYLEYMTV